MGETTERNGGDNEKREEGVRKKRKGRNTQEKRVEDQEIYKTKSEYE